MTKEEINNLTIEAAQKVRMIREKYNISSEDLAILHKSYERIHGEHILTETQRTLIEMESLKKPFDVARAQLGWIAHHLSIPFFVSDIKKEDLKRL